MVQKFRRAGRCACQSHPQPPLRLETSRTAKASTAGAEKLLQPIWFCAGRDISCKSFLFCLFPLEVVFKRVVASKAQTAVLPHHHCFLVQQINRQRKQAPRLICRPPLIGSSGKLLYNHLPPSSPRSMETKRNYIVCVSVCHPMTHGSPR